MEDKSKTKEEKIQPERNNTSKNFTLPTSKTSTDIVNMEKKSSDKLSDKVPKDGSSKPNEINIPKKIEINCKKSYY